MSKEQTQAEQLAELGVLTGHLMHELRNPLSTIKLNLQLLGEDIRGLQRTTPAEQTELHRRYQRQQNKITTVTRETERLADTLSNFLRYAGKIELHRTPQDINLLVDELLDFYEPQAQHAGMTIRRNLTAQPALAAVDVGLLKQAVLNLMINAVGVMEPGGELMVTTKNRPGRIEIDVIDTGPGIAAELQEKIFEAYFSTRSEGTGLGLAICRRIVREHGGDIELYSEPGKGSCFALLLPELKETGSTA